MSVFTAVGPAELDPWLARRGVGPLSALVGIAEGVQNSNYRVETPQGVFALTLFEQQDAAAVAPFIRLLVYLGEQGLPCPRPLPDAAGQVLGTLAGKPALLASWLPGRLPGDPISPNQCAQVGAWLAAMHGLTGLSRVAGAGLPGPNPRGAAWRGQTGVELLPLLSGEDARLLEKTLAEDARPLPPLPRGIIHADLFRDNTLFQGETLGGVLDFYFAGEDVLLFDLAVAANDWCVRGDGRFDPLRLHALVHAYHQGRPLLPGELAVWPRLTRAAALRFWLSRLADSLQQRAGSVVTVKDPGWFGRMLACRWESLPEECCLAAVVKG